MSLPSPYGDGAKTQGHALYNRPLDAHARRRKSRRKDLEPPRRRAKYFILKYLDFFIEENVVSLFHWALFVLNFDFVSKKNLKIAPANTGNNISSMKRSRDLRIKYINILLSSWEVPSLFSCFSSTSMRI